ncbi:MAG: helix-turn-helix domain containing protein [Ancalomicrobiaceae bacterium]|nr:helix-turn-helix domain containing protein [Ancalomicrobiaceae bacterium]
MSDDGNAKARRKPRADAERNRRRLLDVARVMFAENGADASLEEIARRAEVGIGTLYRHFATREALLAEVYRHALEQLGAAAPRLLEELRPVEALKQWMRLFVDYSATKRVIAPAFQALTGGTSTLHAGAGDLLGNSINLLAERAVAAGEIHLDLAPTDLLRAVFAVTQVDDAAAGREAAFRMIDILLDGMKSRTQEPAALALTPSEP